MPPYFVLVEAIGPQCRQGWVHCDGWHVHGLAGRLPGLLHQEPSRCLVRLVYSRLIYSGNLHTGNLNIEIIPIPGMLKIGIQMVWFFNCWSKFTIAVLLELTIKFKMAAKKIQTLENRTIQQLDNFGPFKNGTFSVLRYPLYLFKQYWLRLVSIYL